MERPDTYENGNNCEVCRWCKWVGCGLVLTGSGRRVIPAPCLGNEDGRKKEIGNERSGGIMISWMRLRLFSWP